MARSAAFLAAVEQLLVSRPGSEKVVGFPLSDVVSEPKIRAQPVRPSTVAVSRAMSRKRSVPSRSHTPSRLAGVFATDEVGGAAGASSAPQADPMTRTIRTKNL